MECIARCATFFFVNTLILEYEVNNMNLDAYLPGVVRPLYKQQVIMR